MLGAVTVIVMDADPESPPESVADAVIVCDPALSALVKTVPPDPIAPSRFDVQEMLPLMSPSCVSMAVAVNVTD